MNRNVTVLVIILIIILISGYLIWLRQKFQAAPVSQPVVTQTPQVLTPTPTPTPTITATPTASPSASPTVSPRRLTPTPTKTSVSGQRVR
ncbi:MAG: hypothetical protein M1142_01395 [Patescibacteria group bacterium]|nr:hypothetical protein [Patescibacteria group bacterium]